MGLSVEQKKAVSEVALRLGAKPAALEALIRFETAGTFDPAIKNKRSSARGLIQFLDATAASLGYADSLDLVESNPTFEGQLRGPVFNYLRQWGRVQSDQDLFMRVFYPAFRLAPPNQAFPAKVQKVNPGIVTPADYVRKVYAQPGVRAALAMLAAAAGAGMFFF